MTPSLKNRLKNRYFLGFVVVVIIAAVGLWYFHDSHSEDENIGEVERTDLSQKVTIAGTITPNRKTLISASYNGYVRKVYVKIGQKVHAGDPIVSLGQSLKGRAEEEVYPMRAPFDGTVVQILRTEGEYVDPQTSQGMGSGTALVRIDDLSQTFIDANAPEIEVGKLKQGQEVLIKASAILTKTYHGKIKSISLAAREQKDWDKSRVEFPVLIEVTDNDGQLLSGMSVVVDIITQKLKNVLTLRHEFIQKDGDQYFVVTVDGERKNITVGLRNEEAFEIKSGVKEGEEVEQTDYLSLIKNEE